MTNINANGAVLYEGPSMLTGERIVAIATGLKTASTNRKTGGLVQVYILHADMAPVAAAKAGRDAAICGDCPLRGRGDGTLRGRACYVQLGNGPRSVYAAYKAGRYPKVTGPEATEMLRGRLVRLGAYGDPAAVPADVWAYALAGAAGWTGYTHQWRRRIARPLQRWCMASVESAADAAKAQRAGWRTFRVAPRGQLQRMPREVVCPASTRAQLTCERCLACSGTASGRRGSVAIEVHGAGAGNLRAA